ncbi:MAG: xanthomonadin transporter, partial [Pseudomonadota bacterium]
MQNDFTPPHQSMPTSPMNRRLALFFIWVLVLIGLGWHIRQSLVIGNDLQLFLPTPTTDQERLLLEEIGEGAASRILVIAIDGDTTEALAETSRAFVNALAGNPHFRLLANGEVADDALADELLASYRYLLSTTLDTQALDAAFLREQLQLRLRDLASPAGALLEPMLPGDPTLEQLKLLQSWQPVQEPTLLYDVWFDARGERALLVAETVAPAFDPTQQRAAIAELQRAFDEVATSGMHLTVSGPGAFSALMEQRTRTEAQ